MLDETFGTGCKIAPWRRSYGAGSGLGRERAEPAIDRSWRDADERRAAPAGRSGLQRGARPPRCRDILGSGRNETNRDELSDLSGAAMAYSGVPS